LANPNEPLQKPEGVPVQAPQEEAKVDQNVLSDDPQIRMQQVHDKLATISSAPPSVKDLINWKRIHGDLFVLPLEELGQAYIYRYLKRQEWTQLMAQGTFEKLTAEQIDDLLFDKCVLWPSLGPMEKAGLPAGLIPTMVTQIRVHSLWLDPGQLVNLTVRL